VKVYRRHNCTARHRTFKRFVECAIPRAVWVEGEGPYAVISWCNVPAVTLWPTAEKARNVLDSLAMCGHHCTGNHEVVVIVLGP
jgi:hypothetical protein